MAARKMEVCELPGSQSGKSAPARGNIRTAATQEYLKGFAPSQIKQESEQSPGQLCESQKREAPRALYLDGRNSPSSQSPENNSRPPLSRKDNLHQQAFSGKAANETFPVLGCMDVPEFYEGLDSSVEVTEQLGEEGKLSPTLQCQRFRQFRYDDAEGPEKAFGQLWDRCCQWLKPERHSKEQILELVILEQFLRILPPEMQKWVLEQCPETGSQAVALAEDFLQRLPQGDEQRGDLRDLPDEPSNSEVDPLDIVKVEIPMDGDRRKMEVQDLPGSRAGKREPARGSIQNAATQEYLKDFTPSQIKEESEKGMDQLCESQKREAPRAPYLDGRNSPSSQFSPENNTSPPLSRKADLHQGSFSGKAANETFPGLGCMDVPEFYEGLDSSVEVTEQLGEEGKLSVMIQCQRFRQFRYDDAEGPEKAFGQLWDRCCQWLKPERHSKEQILELVILEQFLRILPPEMQKWVLEQCPETGSQAVALAEDFLQRLPQGDEQRGDLRDLPDEPSNSEVDPLDIVKVEIPMDGDRRKMEVQDLPGSRAGKREPARGSIQNAATQEYLKDFTPSQIKEESEKGMDQLCESQKREAPRAPYLDGRNSPSSQFSPENNTSPPLSRKADLHQGSFSGKAANETFPGLGCMDVPEFYEGLDSSVEVTEQLGEEGKLSVMIQCQRFRQFRYDDAEGPEKAFGQLWDRCCQWLKPERHSKEQILELVILEQFLRILPPEMQKWVLEQCPETGSQAVALAEDFLQRLPQGDEQREDLGDLPDEPSNSEVDSLDTVKVQVPMDGDRSSDHQQYFLGEVTDLPKETYNSGKRMRATSDSPARSQKVALKKKLHKCQYCGKLSDCHSHLMIHERTHTGEKPYKCAECGETFSQKRHLVIHKWSHTGERPHQCAVCGKGFNQKSDLITHTRTHTGEKPYVCSDCGKSFISSCQLRKHERIHTGEKPYQCSDCGKCFAYSYSLTTHRRTHTGEKPYQCLDCGKCFISSSYFATHRRTHTGEKPRQRNYFGNNFLDLSQLAKHEVSHNVEKSFICSECGKSFPQNQEFKKHMQTHSGEKLYRCPECGKTFSSSFNLSRHQKIHAREKL
ncbi:zinc finger protein 263-like isoform X2 [Erythrolamprus reginae]|uniref:zinc finger protein 263-like isoform X2 n=1 Tax=Erythrolamprus reginae TaxID=121349 RepID=UPI00396C9BB6